MKFYDRVMAGKPRRTADGYLVADAKVARTGIQTYLGAEVGRPDLQTVRVYRPEAEVFSRDALNTYAHRPMTNDHPSHPVTADNWKDFAVGQTGGDVVRDGEFVRVPLVLMDSAAIKEFEDGKRELSMGYEAEIVFQDGETDSGEKYDAVQTNLRMNHLALVSRARGGDQLRIGDRHNPNEVDQVPFNFDKGGHHMADNLRKVVLDGLTIETTEQGEQAIAKLQSQIADSAQALTDSESSFNAQLADKDREIAQKDAEIDDLKSKALSDADMDKKVADRAELVAKAKSIHDADYSGKSDADIRKEVVAAKFGDSAIEGKSQDYIDARFDILVETGNPDPVRTAMSQQKQSHQVSDADTAYADNVNYLQTAWKGQKEA